ncbi:response regulator transcription factor [Phenylobacterium sp. LjRoot219]|uniref:response regulator n=1 Tax=Phenylobacterium sp. LjRoot219 TaxID=3342283 RepID=UPI003ECCCFD4
MIDAPHVVVLEVGLPLLNGIAVTRQLRRQRPQTSVLMFTAHDDDESINAGLAAGARGFVLKSDAADVLEPAISALGAGRTYFSACVTELLLAPWSARAPAPLEQWELQVAQLMAEACSSKQIARASRPVEVRPSRIAAEPYRTTRLDGREAFSPTSANRPRAPCASAR